jgi:hypothetical protein
VEGAVRAGVLSFSTGFNPQQAMVTLGRADLVDAVTADEIYMSNTVATMSSATPVRIGGGFMWAFSEIHAENGVNLEGFLHLNGNFARGTKILAPITGPAPS